MFIQAFYNVVDSFFVSMISEQALAAVTYIFPVQMLIISVAVGTGVGRNALIARRLGAQRYEEADLAASHGYRISFFNWMFFALIGIFLSGPMMHMMSDTPYIVENGEKYMFIITVGSLFSIISDHVREDPAVDRKHEDTYDMQYSRSGDKCRPGSYVYLRCRTVP